MYLLRIQQNGFSVSCMINTRHVKNKEMAQSVVGHLSIMLAILLTRLISEKREAGSKVILERCSDRKELWLFLVPGREKNVYDAKTKAETKSNRKALWLLDSV